jgi:uncharacterized protein
MTSLRQVRDELAGISDRDFVDLLTAQVDAALDGARVARKGITGQADSADARELMGEIEHAGDDYRSALVTRLARALTTPFDREDLFRLSRSIDDVLDNLRDFVRERHLFDVTDEAFVPILEAVEACLAELDVAVAALNGDRSEIVRHALAASKASNQVRRLYQDAVAAVLNIDEVTPEVLKRRELLRRLDVVGLRLGEAADALADGAVKRSH